MGPLFDLSCLKPAAEEGCAWHEIAADFAPRPVVPVTDAVRMAAGRYNVDGDVANVLVRRQVFGTTCSEMETREGGMSLDRKSVV